MVLNENIVTIMHDKGFAYRTTGGGISIFTNSKSEEGIEIDGYNIDSYAYINGEKVFGEASATSTAEAMEYIRNEIQPSVDIEPQMVGPHAEIVDESALAITDDNINMDFITNHPGAIPVLLMLQRTHTKYIKTRPGPKNKATGELSKLKYVDGNYMRQALNMAFMFDWSFEVPETRQDGEFFTALGVLTVNLDGKEIMKSQWGSQKMRGGMELGDALKGATTDALKKCASMFGIASDVYSGEV
ncbi:MAG: Rad52/Rad22 family DNA repair protein [Methanosarcinaceae archaeon]